MRAAATDWPLGDVAIVVAALAGLLGVSALLLVEPAPARAEAAATASVLERSGSVRHRPAESLVWDDARRGGRLAEGDAVFVGPGGAAAIALDDGGRLDLEENSLVVLATSARGGEPATVTLRRGAVSASAAAGAVRIRGAGGEASLRPGAQARIAGGASWKRLDVALLSGHAEVSGSAGLASFPIALASPSRSQRVYLSVDASAVAFSWDPSAARGDAIQIAREPGFAAALATFPGGRGAGTWTPPGPGTYYWRAVDDRGVVRSETRSLVAIEDRPPLAFSPADGEVVIAPAGRPVPFWWTEVDGVAAYVVELSASPGFEDVALSAPATRPGAWIDLRLPEGEYHWRVRSADPERGRSPPSRRVSFRLAHASVPDAPELLAPTVQVEHAAP